MARSRVSLRRALFVSAFAAVSLFSASALAADTTTTTPATTAKTTTTTPATTDKTTTTPANTNTKTTTTPTTTAAAATSNTPATSANTDKTTATSAAADTTDRTTGKTTAVITATGGTQTGDTGTMPGITGTATGTTSKLDLPTLSTTNTGIPTYPAPTVPPTEKAPFMNHSNLPDGTVFIAVGAILGAFGVAIIVWRAVVAYLLHRSIARAALAQHAANDKAPYATAAASPFYKYSDRDSSLNLGGPGLGGGGAGSIAGSAQGRGVRRTNRGPTPSATPSQTNLFFSPTAPGASGMSTGGNRDSRLLPSGFYAAGSASPAGAAAHGQAINMSTLRPDSIVSHGGRGVGPSPPDSPSFGPIRAGPVGGHRNMSGSSLSLNRPASGRAPSAFLDDLLDEQPHLFPPGTGPAHHQNYSQSSLGGGRY